MCVTCLQLLHSKSAANNYYSVLNLTQICSSIDSLTNEMPDGLNLLKYCFLHESKNKIYHYKTLQLLVECTARLCNAQIHNLKCLHVVYNY